MLIKVADLLSGQEQDYDGDEAQVRRKLLAAHPHLHKFQQASAAALVDILDHSQTFSAGVVQAPLGKREVQLTPMAAARALARSTSPDPQKACIALWEADGDQEAAALKAHDQEVTQANLAALRAWMQLGASSAAATEPVNPRSVSVIIDDPGAAEAARQITEAFKQRQVYPANLGGKHSAEALIANCSGNSWYLKPDSRSSPAAGIQDDASNEPRRECAFRAAAAVMHLESWIPPVVLLQVGEREMAAIDMAPKRCRKVADILEEDSEFGLKLFRSKLGWVHQWGAMYYILGETDGNASNLLSDPQSDDLYLIDHGSAFAGANFAPATDRSSFCPYFLRFYGHGPFNTASMPDKLRRMPRVGAGGETRLRQWLQSIDEQKLGAAIARYGVDPSPSLDRLQKLKELSETLGLDLAVNMAWVDPANTELH